MRRNKKIKSIRSHFLQMQVLFLVIVVGGFSLLYFMFADDYYVYLKKDLMNQAFEALKQVDLTDTSSQETLFNQYEDANFRFKVMDDQNLVVYGTGSSARNAYMEVPGLSGWEDWYQAEPEAEYVKTQITFRGRLQQGERTYYVKITENTAAAGNSFAYTDVFLAMLICLTVVVGMVTMWVMTARMLRSVDNINQVANHLARRDFSQKADETVRYRELRELAESVNTMSEEIQDSLIYLEETNHVLAEENLYKEKLNLMRQEFLGNISHELKTPLAILSSHVELLQCMEEQIDRDYYYNSLVEEINRMSNMVENLLELSSMEYGLENMDMIPLDMSVMVDRLLEKRQILVQKKRAKLHFQCTDNCVVMGSERYLSQAVGNYLTNAVKHVEEGGEIRFSLEAKDGFALCTVYNDGEPIPEQSLETIWKSYVTLESDEDHEDGIMSNTGLGLYMVQKIVLLHHGSCGVKNCEHGVLFWLQVPLMEEEPDES